MTTDQADQQTPTEADISAANTMARLQNANYRALIEEFTGYSVWHSSDGKLYATRMTPPTEQQVSKGLHPTLGADSVESLAQQIRSQNKVAELLISQTAPRA